MEMFLYLFGNVTSPFEDVPCECRYAILHNVNIHHVGADVDEGNNLSSFHRIIGLIHVFERKSVDVHNHGGQSGLQEDGQIIVNDILLGGNQNNIHEFVVSLIGPENLEIDIHITGVKRDVSFSFPLDRFREFVFRDDGKVNLLNDYRMTGNRSHDFLGPDFETFDQIADRIHDDHRIHERPIHNGLGWDIRQSTVDQSVTSFRLGKFHNLNGTRTDV